MDIVLSSLTGSTAIGVFVSAFVVVISILVYVFGTKGAEEPKFNKLATVVSDERKSKDKSKKKETKKVSKF